MTDLYKNKNLQLKQGLQKIKNAFCPISQLLWNRFISFFQNKNSENNFRAPFKKPKSLVYAKASETEKPVLKTGF